MVAFLVIPKEGFKFPNINGIPSGFFDSVHDLSFYAKIMFAGPPIINNFSHTETFMI